MSVLSILTNQYLLLIFVLFYPFSYMYNVDWPQSLSTPLQQIPYNYTLEKINLIYTFTSSGVIIFCMKLGNIYDRIPLKISLIIVPIVIFLSQLVAFLVFYFKITFSYDLIIISRIIFGIAGQSTFILQALAFVKIYGQKSGPYIGLGIAISVLGSPANSILTPIFYQISKTISFPLLIGLFISIFNLLIGIFIAIGIQLRCKQMQQKQKLINNNGSEPLDSKQQTKIKPLSLIQQIKSFTKPFWTIQILIFFINSIFAGFVGIGIDLIVKRFGIQYTLSGKFLVIPYGLSTICSFLWRQLKYDLRNIFVFLSGMFLINYIGFFFLPNSVDPKIYHYVITLIFLSILGFIYAGFIMKIVPSINKTIDKDNCGAGYGVLAISYNLGNLFVPFISSVIVSKAQNEKIGYKYLIIMFIILSLICLIISLNIKYSDDYVILVQKQTSNKQKA